MAKIPICMPQMGQSVAQGTVVRWFKEIGEDIELDEVLLEVETDKTTVEVESPATGRLSACLRGIGEIAAAGEVIGYLETADSGANADGGQGAPHAGAIGDQITVSTRNFNFAVDDNDLPDIDRLEYSPCVARLALDNNVSRAELKTIQGSGANGRITRQDIFGYLSQRSRVKPFEDAAEPLGDPSAEDLLLPMTGIRRTIADHMIQSIRVSAHVTMVHAVDFTNVCETKRHYGIAFRKRYGIPFTFTSVIMYVLGRVLPDFPKMRSSVAGTNILVHNAVNIGCAVAVSDESLVVPVVHDVDKLSFVELSGQLMNIINRAKQSELTRAEVTGGTFTLSNFGSTGSIIGTPIINQPQVAILGVGAVNKTPVVIDDQICIREQMYLSLSFDHRVIDGIMGGNFLTALQRACESLQPEALGIDWD